jgi:nicotinamidase-related amidase
MVDDQRRPDGPLAGRLWEEFQVHPGDLLAENTAASAFFPGHCPLPALLAARDISTVLITGTVTNVCCESSARDASTLGCRVIMVADGNAARRDQDHNFTLHTIAWASPALTDIHHQGFAPGRMSDHGEHGEEAPAPPLVHPGVQGRDR